MMRKSAYPLEWAGTALPTFKSVNICDTYWSRATIPATMLILTAGLFDNTNYYKREGGVKWSTNQIVKGHPL